MGAERRKILAELVIAESVVGSLLEAVRHGEPLGEPELKGVMVARDALLRVVNTLHAAKGKAL